MKQQVDLNADLGEGAPGEAELLRCITSASVACGLHAGDPLSIARTIRLAHEAGVAVGAHPSLADRENFGRVEQEIDTQEVGALITYQLGAIASLARAAGVPLRHVKPHGALYNMAARDAGLAQAIAQAVVAFDRALVVFAPSSSELARASAALGLRVAHEFFADRHYRADGTLVPRSRPDALVDDAEEAATRALRVLHDGVVRSVEGAELPIVADTICLHGDSPEAIAFARALRRRLEETKVTLAAPFPE